MMEKTSSRDEVASSVASKPKSRVELHGNKYKKRSRPTKPQESDKKKNRKLSVPSVLLIIILLLPISITAFTLVSKGSKLEGKPGSASGEEVFLDDTSSKEEDPPIGEEKGENEKQPPSNQNEEEKRDQPVQEPVVEVETEQTPETNAKPPEKPETVQPEQKEPDESESAFHTVQQGETLYRISMKYYKSQAGIEKIRSANGLNGNEINVGQRLVIPK